MPETLPESLTPSIEDLNGDANVQTSGVFDAVESYFDSDTFCAELDAAFGYDQPMSDADLDDCYAAEMEARHAPAAKWEPFDAPRPVLSRPVALNPAAWGKAVSL